MRGALDGRGMKPSSTPAWDLTCAAFVTLLSLVSTTAEAAEAEACFPKCREGYVCASSGQCLSECNPPCSGEESCKSGRCVGRDSQAEASTSSSVAVALLAGPSFGGITGGGSSIVGGELAFRFVPTLSGVHGLMLGVRGGAAAASSGGNAILQVHADLGYRATFGTSRTSYGPFVAFTPGVWTNPSTAAFGGTLGGFARFGAFALELPVSVGMLTDFGSRSSSYVRASLLAGVAF